MAEFLCLCRVLFDLPPCVLEWSVFDIGGTQALRYLIEQAGKWISNVSKRHGDMNGLGEPKSRCAKIAFEGCDLDFTSDGNEPRVGQGESVPRDSKPMTRAKIRILFGLV